MILKKVILFFESSKEDTDYIYYCHMCSVLKICFNRSFFSKNIIIKISLKDKKRMYFCCVLLR